jgi:very-short-patch-repair endonuclease
MLQRKRENRAVWLARQGFGGEAVGVSEAKPDISARTPPVAEGCVRPRPEGGHQRTHSVRVLGVSAPVSVSGTRDQRVAAIAERQRGRVRRTQLASAGISDGTVARMVARGFLRREHLGVYAVGPELDVPWGREASALLAFADGCVLSHHSAAALWGLPIAPGEHPIEVTIPNGQAGARVGVVVHRTGTLLPRDVRIHLGLPVTSPARTVLDLAGSLSARALERAVDEGLVTRIVSEAQLRDVVARSSGRRGAGMLKAILGREGPSTRTRSEAEEGFLALVRQAGLPAPEVNARAHGYEIDFLWRAQRVALEIDSWSFHRTRSAFERDRRKGAVLSAAGLSVVRATAVQVSDEPIAVIVRIAQTLAHAA